MGKSESDSTIVWQGKSVISRHVNNIVKAGELNESATVAKIATVQKRESRTKKLSFPLPDQVEDKLRGNDKQIRDGLIISWGLIPRPLGRKYLITFPISRCLRRGSVFLVMIIL